MKLNLTLILCFLTGSLLFAQEKAPEITDDYAEVIAGDTLIINVMENDWGMEGHSIVIMNAYPGDGGSVSVLDSNLRYATSYFYQGIDTVRYVLLDEDNALFSEAGHLVLNINNGGRAFLNVNNVNALIQSFGYQFCDVGAGYVPYYEVPGGSGMNSIFAYSLWMGGLDANNELHLAAERYRMTGADYWNGPVSETYVNQQILDYNKVWSITQDEIEWHRQHWWQSGYEPIDAIKTWPAHGDVSLGQAESLAAFNDRNDDGEYDWNSGDYPAIRGDQGMFFLYNDDLAEHEETGGAKLKVEVHGQAYAFDCPDDSVFNNTIFLHYDVISRTDLNYHDFYITPFLDFDLGYAWDDYVGCDTLLETFYVYNGDPYDEDDTIFSYTKVYGYKDYPPAQGVVFLDREMNSFIGYSNYNGPTGDPNETEEYYNTMQGLWTDGSPITVGGDGTGGSVTTKYLYSGDPAISDEWTEVSEGNAPMDRRAVASIGPFDLNPGDTISFDLALVFARDYAGDYISSVSLLKERVQQLRWYYDNDSTPCGKAWTVKKEIEEQGLSFSIYPNPASDWVNIHTRSELARYEITDIAGRKVKEGLLNEGKESINLSGLRKGIYIVSVIDKKACSSCKLLIK